MELNEFFKSYSLETINERTNIPIEVLERIKNKEWEKLKKVQTLGFLKIMEREFEVDLSEAKKEIEEFFKDFKTKEPISPIDLVDVEIGSSTGNKIVSLILTIITIIAVGYTGWYYYNKQNSVPIEGFDENNETQNSNNSSIIIEQTNEQPNNSSTESIKKEENKFNPTTLEQPKEPKRAIVDNTTQKAVESLLNENNKEI
ncbi:MAG: hypothetical protein GXN91_00570, partial [Epsilonproteobacteria bacterium]|nr:hypothetical protein [Campylobacterota bacterium]